jgi:Fur family ferric uptake transcriptional regulator
MNEEEENKLQNRGIRPTAMRIMVLKYLTELGHTSSLIDLENHFDYADKSTLYRTLKTFEEKGIVHKVDDGSGIIKYGLCSEKCECGKEDQHFHFYCEVCKETYCLNTMSIPDIELPPKFIIKQANLVLKGICPNCNPVA